MDLQDFLDHVDRGALIAGGSELHGFMHATSQDALRTIADLNGAYRTPSEVRALLQRLTGKPIPESMTLFPPFYCEFGKNLTLGQDVFVNMGCRFQDTGGITIGDGALIGHGTTLTTLNHSLDPRRRADMTPAPVVIGHNAWLGAGVTVVPGVTFGAGAVVGTGVYWLAVPEDVCDYVRARAAWLKRYASVVGADLVSQAYGYAGSHSDLPMLQTVGRPTAVSPDVTLYREARKLRWPIEG